MKRICEKCGIELDEEELIIIGDKCICADCAEDDDDLVKCAMCGEWNVKDDMHFTFDEEYVCQECADEHYFYCDFCDTYHSIHSTDKYDVRSRRGTIKIACEYCVESVNNIDYCESCNEYIDTEWIDTYNTHYGSTICADCYNNNYATCYGCDEIFLEEDLEYDYDKEEYFCSDCLRRRRKKAIKEYGYKPEPKPKIHNSDVYDVEDVEELIAGVELEIDKGNNPEETAEAIIAAAGDDVYCKRDGSLGGCGIEIVSHPANLEYHMKDLGWQKIAEIALWNGYLSHDARNCGLHVHIGRLQLAPTEDERNKVVAKIAIIMNRHWNELVEFSRRNPSQLDRWAKKPEFQLFENEKKTVMSVLKSRNHGRYYALNLTNSSTIEFRLFNGTLNMNSFFATLQFVFNLCEYAMAKNYKEVCSCQWDDIIHFKEYNELTKYCTDRGIVSVEKPPEDMIITPPSRVGAKVIVRSDYSWDYRWINKIGTVLLDASDTASGDYGVIFDLDEYPELRNFTHELDGSATDYNGRWFSADEINFI